MTSYGSGKLGRFSDSRISSCAICGCLFIAGLHNSMKVRVAYCDNTDDLRMVTSVHPEMRIFVQDQGMQKK